MKHKIQLHATIKNQEAEVRSKF